MSKWESHIKEALMELQLSGDSLEENFDKVLEKKEITTETSSREVLAQELNIVFEDIREYQPPADVLRLIPPEAATHYSVLPLDAYGKSLKVAMIDPTDMELITDLHMLTGLRIIPITSDRETIDNLISQHYPNAGALFRGGNSSFQSSGTKSNSQIKTHSLSDQGTPIIRLVNEVISDAINSGVSDIHLEPFEREMKIRFRQDGVLRVYRTIHSQSMAEVTSRIKIMANMDIAEKRRPQDGRIRMEGSNKRVDMRISTLPTDYGEKIVMRILDKSAVALDLISIGLNRKGFEMLEDAITRPHGMILVTGPTGSGKSTTLYSALNKIKSPGINISTVEDPIEQKVEGIVQTAVRADINVTFANALRTLLRQDPNVIMVGEIRDEETAQISVRAALTGHLVLSTLHTNDAPSTITRLLDMELEPFLVASSLTMVIAQRLVRKICDHCAEEGEGDEKVLLSLELPKDFRYQKGKGCIHCNQTGYRGRIGLFEIMPITEPIRTLITDKKNATVIRAKALEQGMKTLRLDGIEKIKAGITTPEEVLRETTS